MKQYDKDGRFGPNLELLGYKYLMTVEDEKEAKAIYDEIFDPDALIPSYRYSWEDTEFILERREEVEANLGKVGYNLMLNDKREYVDSLLNEGPQIVELSWCYGDTLSFKTKAIISNLTKRIDFDNVVYHISITTSTHYSTKSIVKTRTEDNEPELQYVFDDCKSRMAGGMIDFR